MRHEPTQGEAALWRALRARQLDHVKFRRQQPIDPFIADFFCPAARLVVEIDGITHIDPGADARRDRWMQVQGLRVLQFTSAEVAGNLDGVLGVIRDAVGALPPTPSRKGRGR